MLCLERQCATLPNERITSCESGSMEVGYEGDTCTFSCNTGYVLSGNPTRTCQNDGSWNVPETTCRRSMLPYVFYLLLSSCVSVLLTYCV